MAKSGNNGSLPPSKLTRAETHSRFLWPYLFQSQRLGMMGGGGVTQRFLSVFDSIDGDLVIFQRKRTRWEPIGSR